MITLQDEKNILSIEFRKEVINEITGAENVERKQRELIKHDVFKDLTRRHVIDALRNELSEESVNLMANRASNISIGKKIISKKSKAYKAGVLRSIDENPEASKQINDLAKLVKANSVLRKTDKYKNLFKNCLYQIMPEKDTIASMEAKNDIFKIKHRVILN